MAGVKGRSGGARPNSGGARPGAGRKPKEPQPLPQIEATKASKDPELLEVTPVTDGGMTPLDFLLAVMRSPEVDGKLRLEAAKTAAQYCHLKKGDGGIKDEKAEKAKKAASGKFGAAPPPLRVVNGQ